MRTQMLLEAGVDVGNLHRDLRSAIGKIASEYPRIVVSSTGAGNHGAGSLHYARPVRAVDIWPVTVDGLHIDVRHIRKLLGEDFDVVDEGSHIHIELDPE